MDGKTPELPKIGCPECAPGARSPHSEPDVPHIHLTPYGYLIFTPTHEFRDYIEEIRQFERRAGREDAAREIEEQTKTFCMDGVGRHLVACCVRFARGNQQPRTPLQGVGDNTEKQQQEDA